MRVLVTGGAGFIGSALADALLERGDHVVVMDDLSNGSTDRVPHAAKFVEGDVRDHALLATTLEGVEVVFHQAALRSVSRSLDEPAVVHDVNATGTLAVLGEARTAGARRLVYASSSSVYGGVEDGLSREDMPPNPLSPYAVSKLTGEYYCAVWARLGWLETVSLRYFNVFGPGQRADSQYAAVFPSLISTLLAGQTPEIHWDGQQSRDFTFIDDIVAANLLAAEKAPGQGEVINTAGGSPHTIAEVFQTISQALGVEVEPRYVTKREGDIRHSRADATKARELLGWVPRVPWDDAIARTVEWFSAGTGMRGK